MGRGLKLFSLKNFLDFSSSLPVFNLTKSRSVLGYMTFPSKTKKEKTNKQTQTNRNNNTKIGTVPHSHIFVLSSRCPSFNFRHKSGDQSRKSDSLTITWASRKNVPRKKLFLKKKSDKRNYCLPRNFGDAEDELLRTTEARLLVGV